MAHRNNSSRTFQRDRVTVAPLEDPITVDEVKAHLRILNNNEDALLLQYIQAATLAFERFTNRKLITQTLEAFLDEFPDGRGDRWFTGVVEGTPQSTGISSEVSLLLSLLPVQSVTQLSTFDDADNETVFPLTEYRVDVNDLDLWARISLREGSVWPSDLRPTSGIKVAYVAGYGDMDAVPQDIQLGLMQLVGHYKENRVAVCKPLSEVPLTYSSFANAYKVWNI
jgi:hypothetical protein